MSFYLSKLNIEQLVGVGYLNLRSGYAKTISKRPSAGISIKLEGKTVYEIDGRKLTSDPHHVILLPQDGQYKFKVVSNGKCIVINFLSNEITAMQSFEIKNNLKIIDLAKRASSIWETQEEGKDVAIKGIVYEIAYILLKEKHGSKQDELIDSINEYVDLCLDKKEMEIRWIAKKLGYSESYLRILFKNKYGIPLASYVLKRKLEQAKVKLEITTMSISQVAANCGYATLYAFSKAFKNAFGLSPREYKKNHSVFM